MVVVILVRGINVGGKNRLPMKELAAVLESCGLEEVRTYIQSGNAVARTRRRPGARWEEEIEAAIEARVGFRPLVFLITAKALRAAVEASPFREEEPGHRHLALARGTPRAVDEDRLDALAVPTESWSLQDRFFHLHAPEGIGRSKLAAAVESVLGRPTTSRNGKTLEVLLRMAEELEASP